MPQSIRDRLFAALADFIVRRPVAVLVVALLLAAGSIVYTSLSLEFQPDRNRLVSERLPWNARFQAWARTFGGLNDLFVIVDTRGPDGEPRRERAERFVDALAADLRDATWIESVVTGFDPAAASPKLVRLLPLPEYEARLEQIAQSRRLLASPTPAALIQSAIAEMGSQESERTATEAAEAIAEFRGLIDAFTARLEAPAELPFELGARIEGDSAGEWRYLATANDRFLIVRITPRVEAGELSPVQAAIDEVRLALLRVAAEYPGIDFGLTGQEVIEADETAAAIRDATFASALATVLIVAAFIYAFRRVKLPLLFLAALLVGTAWSFAFATLAVGHLQVISVVFTAMLLGLGGDFGIHIASRFELTRAGFDEGPEGFAAALRDTVAAVGPGILTGGLTTAAAFATTVFTRFTGVAEMGLIAAGGVLLCMAAMFTVFPALMRLFAWRRQDVSPPRARRLRLFNPAWLGPIVRAPWLTVAVAALVLVGAGIGASRLRFNYDITALLPRGAESTEWQRKLVEEGGQSVWFATSIATSLDEVRERAAAFRALPTVDAVLGAGLLAPPNEAEKAAAARLLRASLPLPTPSSETDADAPALAGQVAALRLGLALRLAQAPPELREPLTALLASLDRFLTVSRSLDPVALQARLEALQADYARWRQAVADRVAAALDPAPLGPADLPAALIGPYVAEVDGEPRYALEVYMRQPGGQGTELRPETISRFVDDVYRVDPEATGVVVQVYESGRLIWTSYLQAGVFGLAVVFAIVWVDFRSLIDAMLALVPVTLGFLVTFGLLRVFGQDLNPANIIVLPLMFGIGVDAGVHVMHRFRLDPSAATPGLTGGTGKGITLTSLTTMIGFGALIPSSHRGLASLGLVMTTGIGLTLLACFTLMPAILTLRRMVGRRPT